MTVPTVQDKYFEKWVTDLPDISSCVVVITGTTSGTGFHASTAAIRKSVTALFLLNRASERANAAFNKLKEEKDKVESTTELFSVDCDLQDFESVRKAAETVIESASKFGGVTTLGNNAGIMAFPDKRTKDGYEVQMQTNHLSHFLLTKLLFPSMLEASKNGKEVRICQQSSIVRFGDDLRAINFEKTKPGSLGGDTTPAKLKRYHFTKLSNALFGLKLHKELQEKGYDVTKIKSVFAEPGVSSTGLFDNMASGGKTAIARFGLRTFLKGYMFFMPVHGAGDGSLPLIQALFGADVQSGDFYLPEKYRTGPPVKALTAGSLTEGNKRKEKEVLSNDNQELLWTKSEEAVGAFFPKAE